MTVNLKYRTCMGVDFGTVLTCDNTIWLVRAYCDVSLSTELVPNMDSLAVRQLLQRLLAVLGVKVQPPLTPRYRVEHGWRKHCESTTLHRGHLFHLKQTGCKVVNIISRLRSLLNFSPGRRTLRGLRREKLLLPSTALTALDTPHNIYRLSIKILHSYY